MLDLPPLLKAALQLRAETDLSRLFLPAMTDPLEPRDLSHHAPAPEPLSPAAQAVSDASQEAWVTKDDPWSIAAAALRAAALHCKRDSVILFSLADELESQ